MKVAAYQAPLLREGSMEAVSIIQAQVRECEAEEVSVLCCPEAVLGGLADYSQSPAAFAIRTDNGQLASLLAPLTSDTVTSIVGFSELSDDGKIYNAAAIFQSGKVVGIYRKIHPAIRRSIYAAGTQVLAFRIRELTFGVVICNDSNYSELTRSIAAQGARVLFIPTNNGLPKDRANSGLSVAAQELDLHLALENRMWVVRADVAGDNGVLNSYGCSEIVDAEGNVVRRADTSRVELLVADI